MAVTKHHDKGQDMTHRQTHTIRLMLGFHIPKSMEAAAATRLTAILGLKTAKFDVSRDQHCTTFSTDRPVRCSIERSVKLHAFIDGVRFACIAMG